MELSIVSPEFCRDLNSNHLDFASEYAALYGRKERRPTEPQKQQQGRPAYCFSGKYVWGKALQDIASITSTVGLAATFMGAPEVGLPMLGVAGAMDIGGSLLQDSASGKLGMGTALKIGESAVVSRIPVAKSVRREAAAINEGLGKVQDRAVQAATGENPCD